MVIHVLSRSYFQHTCPTLGENGKRSFARSKAMLVILSDIVLCFIYRWLVLHQADGLDAVQNHAQDVAQAFRLDVNVRRHVLGNSVWEYYYYDFHHWEINQVTASRTHTLANYECIFGILVQDIACFSRFRNLVFASIFVPAITVSDIF